jgi:maltooligosyltrehalose trehalohydrolase
MLFQGQEFASSSPFFFFASHNDDLRPLVREGRIQFLSQFRALAQPEMRPYHVDPGDPATFERCKLDFGERQKHAGIYEMHKDLLRLRKEDRALAEPWRTGGFDGAVLSNDAFLLRYFGDDGRPGDSRLLIVNLGRDLRFDPAPEPLLAPPEGHIWDLRWSSEDPRYGGSGTPPVESPDGWRIPGHAAVVLYPAEEKPKWQI